MKLVIERMTPDEVKDGGRHLSIAFSFGQCDLGNILIAYTKKGICYLGFAEPLQDAYIRLEELFPNAEIMPSNSKTEFSMDRFHVKATDLQFAVWNALMQIPIGETVSYSDVARAIGKPTAIRAVATAIGQNPIAILIPCHRVIHADGSIGNYFWGPERKAMLLIHEHLATQNGDNDILPLLN